MSTPYSLELFAAFVYLIPVLVMVWMLIGRGMGIGEVAIWVPATIALDVVTCLLATRLVPFDVAWVGSRVVWLGVGGALFWRRRTTFRPSPGWDTRSVLTMIAAAASATLFSLVLSRDYPLWDRDLHIPMIPLLRAQRVPFAHVFQTHTVFHYHFVGDAIAAALQTFSGARLHAALTLSLAHDLMFGLIGLSVAAWVCSLTPRRLWIVPAVLALFLIGPLSIHRPAAESRVMGFSCMSFWGLSYRPHVAPSALFLIGLLACVVQRVSHRLSHGLSRHLSTDGLYAIAAFCLTVALGVTDEASIGVYGIALGLTWLIFPEVLASRRIHGLALLVAMAAGILAVNVALAAAIAPGGPVQVIRAVSPRLPGLLGESQPLFSEAGRRNLLLDLGPLMLLQIAVVGWALSSGGRHRLAVATLLISQGVVAGLAFFLLEINSHPSESHRFVTIGQVFLTVSGLLVLAQTRAGDWPRGLIWASFFLSAASTVFWARNGISPESELSSRRLDCREATGAHLVDQPRPTYVPRAVWFTIAGCRPMFTPGTDSSWVTLQTSGPAVGRAAFQRLHSEFVAPGAPLDVACPPGHPDPACALAQELGPCREAGTQFTICAMPAAAREGLLKDPAVQASGW